MTEKLKIPFVFMGKEYYDRSVLRKALMENWDMGAAALKRGAFLQYFEKLSNVDFENMFEWMVMIPMCQEVTNQMWDENYHEDVVFAKFLRYLDTKYNEAPKLPKDEKSVGSITKEEFKQQFETLPPFIKAYYERCGEKCSAFDYDDKAYESFMLLQAKNGKLLHTYIEEFLASGW